MEIELPWFNPILMPNKKKHRFVEFRARKAQRIQAHWLTLEQWREDKQLKPPLMLNIMFYPPDRRSRDKDGCFSAIKGALDGIADALEIDDKHFSYSGIDFGKPVKGGRIIIKIAQK